MKPLQVTIFSDFTCPYCYVTEAALWRHAADDGVELRYRAFELHPAPGELPTPSEAEWRAALTPLADEVGVTLTAPAVRARTAKAHEAARFAAERELETPFRKAVFAAFWERGLDIGRIDVLTSLAAPLGIDAEEMKIALDIDTHRQAVEHDASVARQLRIPGAPTIYLGTGSSARVLVGAYPASVLDEALDGS